MKDLTKLTYKQLENKVISNRVKMEQIRSNLNLSKSARLARTRKLILENVNMMNEMDSRWN